MRAWMVAVLLCWPAALAAAQSPAPTGNDAPAPTVAPTGNEAPAPTVAPTGNEAPTRSGSDTAVRGTDVVGPAEQAPSATAALPAEHVPRLKLSMTPASEVHVGDAIKVTIEAEVPSSDDVAVPDQPFAPFELTGKRRKVTDGAGGAQRFTFELDLLALESGHAEVPAIALQVVTKDGLVGTVHTEPRAIKVTSWIENEPDAKLRPEGKPVVVLQDDYTLLYVLGGLLAAGVVALITFFITRYLQRREKPLPPPPPPRPPWEVAIEKLADLRRRKQTMVEAGEAARFVDEVSDVAREYLGARFGFDGLESTSDEAIQLLGERGCNLGLLQEVGAYLRRCDLIKFAKVDPDKDEADLVFAKAQDIVQFSTPLTSESGAGDEARAMEAP